METYIQDARGYTWEHRNGLIFIPVGTSVWLSKSEWKVVSLFINLDDDELNVIIERVDKSE